MRLLADNSWILCNVIAWHCIIEKSKRPCNNFNKQSDFCLGCHQFGSWATKWCALRPLDGAKSEWLLTKIYPLYTCLYLLYRN